MKTKLPLIIGIALPLVFIAAISIFIVVSSHSVQPQQDFIYSNDDSYSYSQYKNTYTIVNGHVAVQPIPLAPYNSPNMVYVADNPPLYEYDVHMNTSRKLTLEEAQKLNLDDGPVSDDGYTVQYEYNDNGIFDLFGSRSDSSNHFYVEKGSARKRLDGMAGSSQYYYPGNFRFIGWIKYPMKN